MVGIKFNNKDKVYLVHFKKTGEHTVIIAGQFPKYTTGFVAYSSDGKKVLGDYSEYTTIYREGDGFVEYSNDGSTEPTKAVEITAEFNGGERFEPNSVSVRVEVDSEESEIEILKSNNWIYELEVLEHCGVRITSADEDTYFKKSINGNTVTYDYIENPTPTDEDRIEALEEAVCELYEMIGG